MTPFGLDGLKNHPKDGQQRGEGMKTASLFRGKSAEITSKPAVCGKDGRGASLTIRTGSGQDRPAGH